MPDFTVRSDSVNVEQIMDQIRARIRDKRGVDYTEQEIRELAAVRLERFLDPRGVRSDLLEEFRRSQPPPSPGVPLYPFEESTLFDSHRGIVRFFRRLFQPVLKLFFNANALGSSLHAQTAINRQTIERLDAMDATFRRNGDLYYELLHNMVVELTRMSIEVKNAKMRVESIASRLEFNERRARALESVVVYRPAEDGRAATPPRTAAAGAPVRAQGEPQAARPSSPPSQPGGAAQAPAGGQPAEGPGQRSRRRRRRRGRRGGASAATIMGQPGAEGGADTDTSGDEADAGTAAGDPARPLGDAAPAARDAADARDTRPEPFEHTFGSAAHPAESPAAEPSAAAPSRPAVDRPDNGQ
ncbi:MAG: hypothetical protein IT176_04190 [Acidobacteria bacterium]|nr:hypothetical protein [Acidobacteriota bacterium]